MARNSVVPGGISARLAPKHRNDIDALRAVAVGLVILFHYGVPGFSGGFAGVDIFFVISGFLIGGIIDRELAGGHFSFLNFYERRVRRIFPALFAMLAACAAAASVLLYPADLQRFADSALAAALFWSNIHFNNVAGYWDLAAHTKPLLHTWSLAVEEQFYLVFPLLLFLLHRWQRRWQYLALGVLFVASFVASVWAVKTDPTGAFYLAPFRFWEFLMGAGLAMFFTAPLSSPASLAKRGEGRGPRWFHIRGIEGWVRSLLSALPWLKHLGPLSLAARWRARLAGDDKGGWVGSAAALLGLAMIAFAALTLHQGTNFPGFGAVLPCLGAALLIAAGPGNAVSRALSWRPVVFVGLISYSLYLWHWPIWVFANAWLGRAPTPWEAAGCAALTFALSVLSWKFVEQPFRNKQAVTRMPLFTAAAGAMAMACLFALVVMQTNGLPQRFGPRLGKIVAVANTPMPVQAKCFGVPSKDVSVRRLCGIGANARPATFVLWGDSHAEVLIPAVADIAKKHGRRGLFAGSPSCAPLVGVNRYDAPDCRPFNGAVLNMILRHKEITTVILMARWGKNAQGTAYGDEGHGFVPIGDDTGKAQKPSDNAAIFARGLDRTVAALRAAGKQVLLVGPVPEIGWTVPQVLARLEQEHKGNVVVAPPAKAFYEREAQVLPLFHEMAERDGVSAVFPHDYLCQSGRCAVRKNGVPLYRDEHHLSDYGARKLEPLLSRAMDPLLG